MSTQFYFYPIRVDVQGSLISAYTLDPTVSWHIKGQPLDDPLVLTPAGQLGYFRAKEGFSISGLLANPMLLLTGFTMLLMFALPKMNDAIDPEYKVFNLIQEIKKNQPTPELPDISNSLANWFLPPEAKNK